MDALLIWRKLDQFNYTGVIAKSKILKNYRPEKHHTSKMERVAVIVNVS